MRATWCATHDFDRYAAAIFVPRTQRRALLALYAFNAEVVRVPDHVTQPIAGEIRLQWWRDMLSGEGHGGIAGNPVAAELRRAIDVCRLPVEGFIRLTDEHRFDVYADPMPSLAALEAYLDDTASVLFSLATQILGAEPGACDALARHAGRAWGIAALLGELPRHAARRRLFVPVDLLERPWQRPRKKFFAGRETPSVRAALDDLNRLARGHLDRAIAGLSDAPRSARVAFLPLALVRRDLAQMARADQNPFAPKPRSRLSTLWTLWRASRLETFSG